MASCCTCCLPGLQHRFVTIFIRHPGQRRGRFASLLSIRLRRLSSMPAEASTSSSNQLPSYEDIQAERDLKESFAQLLKDHEEIQRLFKSVATQLDTTPKIGGEHELTTEWHHLAKVSSASQLLGAESRLNVQQKHKKLYRDSQLNSSQCASFLSST